MAKTYTISNLSERQLQTINIACDLLTRIYLGQLDACADVLIGQLEPEVFHELNDTLRNLRPVITGMERNASFGIGNPKCDPLHRTAYDLHCVVRRHLAWERNPDGGYTVDFDEPQHISDEPLPEVTTDVDSN